MARLVNWQAWHRRPSVAGWLSGILLSLMLSPCSALAQGSDSSQGQSDSAAESGNVKSLQDFFKLTEQLPQAICDDATLSRPPTLNTEPSNEAFSRRMFIIQSSFSEAEVMSFLLDDSQSFIAAPEPYRQWKALESQSQNLQVLKRGIARDICTAFVSPGKINQLKADRPQLFIPAKPLQTMTYRFEQSAVSGSDALLMRDVDQRIGQQQGQWQLAGWLESYEVEWIRSQGRLYRRLSHPVTHQLEAVQLLSEQGLPVAQLFPTSQKMKLDWNSLEAQAQSNDSHRKKVASYHLQIELAAFDAFNSKPDRVDQIRMHQEFYKNLLAAYEIYPQDERFKKLVTRVVKVPSVKDVKKILNSQFFEQLSLARVNGAYVSLSYLAPDPRLHAIYLEFEEKLRAMLK